MGTWAITVEGHGIHHNGRQDDAEAMAAVFVGELRAAGHEVSRAEFVLTGGTTDVLASAPEVASRHATNTGEMDYFGGLGSSPVFVDAHASGEPRK